MEKARLKWACKRGMLELDLILMPYHDAIFESASDDELNEFAYLLTQEDSYLYSWFMETGNPEEPRLNDMVRKILSFHSAKAKQSA